MEQHESSFYWTRVDPEPLWAYLKHFPADGTFPHLDRLREVNPEPEDRPPAWLVRRVEELEAKREHLRHGWYHGANGNVVILRDPKARLTEYEDDG